MVFCSSGTHLLHKAAHTRQFIVIVQMRIYFALLYFAFEPFIWLMFASVTVCRVECSHLIIRAKEHKIICHVYLCILQM